MNYEIKRVIAPMIAFIKTIPFADEFHIDMSRIDTQQIETGRSPGTAIDYIGSSQISDKHDIQGRRIVTRQANFQLWLLRESGTNLYRTETADFLYNLEHWVEHCQHYGLTPKIGGDPNDEVMWADNGMFFSEWEGETAAQYMIQIHIIYTNIYESEDDF